MGERKRPQLTADIRGQAYGGKLRQAAGPKTFFGERIPGYVAATSALGKRTSGPSGRGVARTSRMRDANNGAFDAFRDCHSYARLPHMALTGPTPPTTEL